MHGRRTPERLGFDRCRYDPVLGHGLDDLLGRSVGQKAEAGPAMPSIQVENGTEVTVRIGRSTSAALTADEIELAKSLNVN